MILVISSPRNISPRITQTHTYPFSLRHTDSCTHTVLHTSVHTHTLPRTTTPQHACWAVGRGRDPHGPKRPIFLIPRGPWPPEGSILPTCPQPHPASFSPGPGDLPKIPSSMPLHPGQWPLAPLALCPGSTDRSCTRRIQEGVHHPATGTTHVEGTQSSLKVTEARSCCRAAQTKRDLQGPTSECVQTWTHRDGYPRGLRA